ncbi:MAG: hypothetical protein ABIJ09_16740 [Pseudomonadota bacterium]
MKRARLIVAVLWSCAACVVACDPGAGASDASDRDVRMTDLGPGADVVVLDAGPRDHGTSDAQAHLLPGLEGRICAPSGDFFIADAVVSMRWLEERGVRAVTHIRSTRSGPGGAFRLRDLPTGHFHVDVRFGRLHLVFEADILAPGMTGTLESGLTPVGDHCFDGAQLKLAVVTGIYDSIEHVIEDLGFTDVTLYGEEPGWHQTFFDPALLAQYDAVYFNCGLDDTSLSYAVAASALRTYVAQGGSVYASDWAYFLVEHSWPEQVDFLLADLTRGDALLGATGDVQAELHGSAVSKTCGRQALISFDLPYWAVMERVASSTELLASGTIEAYASESDWDPSVVLDNAPLMIRFAPAQDLASVVFTSFHNEAQATDDMLCILKTMILSL